MACYRNGGCGPYEGRSCSECPASKPEYASFEKLKEIARSREDKNKVANIDDFAKNASIKIKVFLSEDGVSCVMKDTYLPVEIEIIDEVAVKTAALDCGEADSEGDDVDAYINQLCGDGFVYVEDEKIIVTDNL